MTEQELYQRAKAIYVDAIARPADARAVFVREACEGDLRLLDEVVSLLAFDNSDATRPAAEPDPPAPRPDDRDPVFAAGDVFAGRYRVVSRLGVGGMGEVYRADDLTLGEPVALKLLLPDGSIAPERLLEEVRLARRVTHPSVCRVFDVSAFQDRHFFTMELVDGEDLGRVLRRVGRLPSERVLEIAQQLCAGLESAHAAGVLHRDLKPANILIDAEGGVHITDFGIATAVGSGPSAAGTPAYMAPEQLAGLACSPATDLYALGLVLYELVSGQRPHDGESLEALREQRRRVRVQDPSDLVADLDARLGRAILRALEPEPARRYASAAEMTGELGAVSIEPIAAPSEQLAPAGQRRLLTLVFVDNDLRVDDEEMHHSLSRALASRAEEIAGRYEASFEWLPSGEWLFLLGTAAAREDDPLRAARIALEVVDLAKAPDPAPEAAEGAALDVRVAVHGDLGIVESGGGRDLSVLRHSPVLKRAIQLAREAAPGQILLSKVTANRLGSSCVVEEHGGGEAGVYQLLSVRDATQEAFPRYRNAFVGRGWELELLVDRFDAASEGLGQLVWLTGEPGLGKSRLIARLREVLPPDDVRCLVCRASSLTQQTPFFGAAQLLRQEIDAEARAGAGIDPTDLKVALDQVGSKLQQAAPLLASLLSMTETTSASALGLEVESRRLETLDAMVDLLLSSERAETLILVFEDVQWTDPSTREVLERVVEQAVRSRVLVIATARPGTDVQWRPQVPTTPLVLQPLNRRHSRELVADMQREDASGSDILATILDRAGGVPLHLEALARVPPGSGGQDGAGAIPYSLQDSLASQLDQIGPARSLAQLCSVLGREFDHALVAAVSERDAGTLRRDLRLLVDRGILHVQGRIPEAHYAFAHVLVQDAAYASILPKQRRRTHLRIAEAIASTFPQRASHRPEILAHHYAEAGHYGEAARQWWNAAQRSAARHAWEETTDQLQRLLAPIERDHWRPEPAFELDVRFLLGMADSAVRGLGQPETMENLERVRSLCLEAGDDRRLAEVAYAFWWVMTCHADAAGTYRALAEFERVCKGIDEGFLHARLEGMRAVTHVFAAEVNEAIPIFERIAPLFERRRAGKIDRIWGLEPRVDVGIVFGFALAGAGQSERAERTLRMAIGWAEEGGAPFTLAGALLIYANALLVLREDGHELLEVAQRGRELSESHRLSWSVAFSVIEGAARVRLGEVERGLELAERGLDEVEQVGLRVMLAITHWTVADAQLRLGQAERALTTIEHAIERSQASLDRFPFTALWHLQGRALAALGRQQEAQVSFDRCLALAQASGVKVLPGATPVSDLEAAG